MPIYEYECTRCGRRVEELQKYEDPPPRDDAPCTSSNGDRLPCDLQRVPTTFEQRWPGDYSNEGRGGWKRQGKFMVKRTEGK